MDLTFYTIIFIPAFLGLLGFIEPCTVGSHLIFLRTLDSKRGFAKAITTFTFILVRSLTAGLFGALVALAGKPLVSAQTGLWLVFGLLYFLIGLSLVAGKFGIFKMRLDVAPANWKYASSPVPLGLAFGLNIPACAAPIIFGLLGMAAAAKTTLMGFAMMAIFGLALSLPLIIVAVIPALAGFLEKMSCYLRKNGWILGVLFILLGLWSIWFGLYVDPENWAGQ